MRAIDTNVLVRLIARDHPQQLKISLEIAAEGAWISLVVLTEALWVLESYYKLGRQEIAGTVETLLGHETLVLQDSETVAAALLQFRTNRKVEFTDCLILETARRAGHAPLGTFDLNFSKLDGVERL